VGRGLSRRTLARNEGSATTIVLQNRVTRRAPWGRAEVNGHTALCATRDLLAKEESSATISSFQ
jgi:hypothetical protein